MPTETIVWLDIQIEVEHERAPVSRHLHRFAVVNISPPGAHVPLPPPRNGAHHYVGRTELADHRSFADYFIARLERDASPALIARNKRVVEAARQLPLDL
jgi:hypothetical protein